MRDGTPTPTNQTKTTFKTMNFKTLAVASLITITGIIGVAHKADAYSFSSCNSYGNSTSCYGSNGSSYNSSGFSRGRRGGFRQFSGVDANGNSYMGHCTRIGSYTNCQSY